MARILHIEDDSANRLLVRKILSPAGFDVVDAVDGVEGIRKAISEHPDLVLVDIAIPGLDGYEVTLRLRAEPHLRHVPIVAITAEGNRETSLAVGLLMTRFQTDRNTAFEVLRDHARSSRRKVNEVAEQLVAAEELLNSLHGAFAGRLKGK